MFKNLFINYIKTMLLMFCDELEENENNSAKLYFWTI